MENQKIVKLFVLFVVSYFILYLLGLISPMHALDFSPGLGKLDYMFVLIPIPGFFLMFFAIDWINDYLQDETANKPWFPALFFVLSVLAYLVALFFFFGNTANLMGGNRSAFDLFDFWQKFWDSAFLYFVLAAVFGWVSHQILERPKKTAK